MGPALAKIMATVTGFAQTLEQVVVTLPVADAAKKNQLKAKLEPTRITVTRTDLGPDVAPLLQVNFGAAAKKEQP